MITEQNPLTEAQILKNIDSLMTSHPLFAQVGVNTKTLAENPWFKTAMKWLPYLPVALIIWKLFNQQQANLMLRRIEKQLQRLEKKT